MFKKWLSVELPGEQENRYRKYYLRHDINQAAVGMMVLMLPLLALVYNDYRFLGLSFLFWSVIAARALFLILTIVLIVYMRRLSRPVTYDRLLFIWALSSVFLLGLINYTRPPNVFTFAFIDVVIVLTYYLLIPNKLINQTITTLLLAIDDILILVLTKDQSVQAFLFAIILCYVLSIVGSTFGSWQISSHRRREFKLYEEEQNSNTELKKALAEVKQLSGLLPICAWCKKIRNDDGYWQAVDTYLREHAKVEFTHGICPECSSKIGVKQPWTSTHT